MASLSFIFGVIGIVITLLMFVSPIKTFKQVVKNKSTENYSGLPYVMTLFITSLWIYYGLLKPGGLLFVGINAVGAALHFVYVTLFLIYAPQIIKIKYVKLVGAVNVALLGVILLITLVAIRGDNLRITVVGILGAVTRVGMSATPLFAMREVIKMKSVKYMPFLLSFFQFINGDVWSTYGLLIKDYYISVPNGIGSLLGSTQLILYAIYKNKSSEEKECDIKGVIQLQGFSNNNEEITMNEQ